MSTKSIANAVGGKTARACDSCVRKRARWYCAADDAFLCQSCDSAVHSANLLASRHHRLRLNSSSSSSSKSPSWLSGLTRKPRTPRPRPLKSIDLVPDAADETTSLHDNESDDHLLFQVPTFDPFDLHQNKSRSDMDLDEFAADVESLLGRNLESEFFDMEGLGFRMDKEFDAPNNRVKVEDDHDNYQLGGADDCRLQHEQLEADADLMREPFEFDFEHEEKMMAVMDMKNERQEDCRMEEDELMNKKKKKKRKVGLRLDCDAVIATWGNDKSPWTTGERPQFDFDDSWPHCMAICGVSYRHMCGEHGVGATEMGDGRREARVLRYKEKRRTRLFSKKIRYEVRKLNAEKRPRMKGRFVKRMPFTQPTLPIISIQ